MVENEQLLSLRQQLYTVQICIHAFTHTHTHTYLYIHTYTLTLMLSKEIIRKSLNNNTHRERERV